MSTKSVRFSNSICTTLEGYDGVCLRRQQCVDAGGIASGTCAKDLGRCCLCKYALKWYGCGLRSKAIFT
nr:unnamed protein product [Callosobruchus analis]